MSEVENRITKLEDEAHALKTFFSRGGTVFFLYEYQTSFSTSENHLITYHDGTIVLEQYGFERVEITFETYDHKPTVAVVEVIEMTGGHGRVEGATAFRVPYDNGCRWIFQKKAGINSSFEWEATHVLEATRHQGTALKSTKVSFQNRRDKAAQLNFQNRNRHIYITGVQVHSSHGSSRFSKEPSWYPSGMSALIK